MENLFLFRITAAKARDSWSLTAGICAAIALLLTGCAAQQTTPAIEPAPAQTEAPQPAARIDSPAVKQLTADARAALQNAEQSVNQARAQQALWTSAVQTLEQARNAAKRFDNESVVRLSTQVNELVRLSLKQRQGPPLKLFD